jgi:hypothetical protein
MQTVIVQPLLEKTHLGTQMQPSSVKVQDLHSTALLVVKMQKQVLIQLR